MLYESVTDLVPARRKIKVRGIVLLLAVALGLFTISFAIVRKSATSPESEVSPKTGAENSVSTLTPLNASKPVLDQSGKVVGEFEGVIYKEAATEDPQLNGMWYYLHLKTPYFAEVGSLGRPQEYLVLKLMIHDGYEVPIDNLLNRDVVINGFVSWGPGSDLMLFAESIRPINF